MKKNSKQSEASKLLSLPRILTIGVYGFSEETFFHTLQESGVDTFCDIRRRRGVRGAKYAFANSKRIQARLAELGIQYFHLLELAPTEAVRERQKAADKASGTAKRKRTKLDDSFIESYQNEVLSLFDPGSFLQELGGKSQVIALFCLERDPEACHRWLVSEKLERELNLEVEHIVP